MANAINALEYKWQKAWQSARCFETPDQPRRQKFYNFDSGPFPNGPLHIGHVRTYVLGDVMARYQRLLGKCVLYTTEWDAFGLPNELGALDAGITPYEFTANNISTMRAEFDRLGISYDWSRVHATCDPSYYRWTQWLFVLLYRRGLVYSKDTSGSWCPKCETSLSRMQVNNNACWRCGTQIILKTSRQWFVASSMLMDRLARNCSDLDQWGSTARKLIRNPGPTATSTASDSDARSDWQISRQRAWGTPIPIIHCDRCGSVPAENLPVLLPESINWRHGASALRRSESFLNTHCPQCRSRAQRETDTLDCFFDDAWSFLSCVSRSITGNIFPGEQMSCWMPIDHFHSGFDTFQYLNLYRLMCSFLSDQGIVPCSEPILKYVGNDVVTVEGRKMGKSAQNAIAAGDVIDLHGADALRLAVLWAASPNRAIDWRHIDLKAAKKLRERLLLLFSKTRNVLDSASDRRQLAVTRTMTILSGYLHESWTRIGTFIEEYRPNAAVEQIADCTRALEDFVGKHAACGYLHHGDGAELRRAIEQFSIVLSPFAPHVAEEAAAIVGMPTLAAQAIWPGRTEPL